MRKDIRARQLENWKIRQEEKGYDVSNVRTLEEAEAFNKLEVKPMLKPPEPEEDDEENETIPEEACHFDAAALEEKSYPELKKLAGDLGLPTNGKKPELIERICSVELCEKHDKENE